MEGDRFDALTKALTTSARSRRQAVAGLALGALALLTGEASAKRRKHGRKGGVDQAAPRCKRVGQVCQTSADCCPEQNGTYCAGTKKLTCQPCATTICQGQCVDTGTDSRNCGSCGTICRGGTSCVGGRCQCINGETDCSGICKNLETDPDNCGQCGNQCKTGAVCCSGTCAFLDLDDHNCGQCGTQCTSGTNCQGGQCQTCTPSGQSCDPIGGTGLCCSRCCTLASQNPDVYVCC